MGLRSLPALASGTTHLPWIRRDTPRKPDTRRRTPRAHLIEDVRYRVVLDLNRGDERFGCDTTVLFRSREPGASTFIDLTAAEVHAVTLNGRTIEPDDVAPTRIHLVGPGGGQ
jgi:hypothetical protein